MDETGCRQEERAADRHDISPEPDRIAPTVAALPGTAAERFGERVAARYKADGRWQERTYAEVGRMIDEIALGLVDLGIEVGDRVCILAETRLEWTLSSYGISAAGAVVVPIYPTNSPHECEWVAGNSGVRAIICEDPGQVDKIEQVRGALPDLEHVIGIEPGTGELTLRPGRADQEVHDSRPRPVGRERRADPDAEGQAQT